LTQGGYQGLEDGDPNEDLLDEDFVFR
jgi:ABC-type lipoprotein release transport system permease subunit